jgi:hypothetical protein
MEPTSPLMTDLPRLLCLVVALAGGLFAALSYVRRQRHSTAAVMQRQVPAPSVGKIIYHDAPTVRVAENQRVDRVRKLARLAPGEHIDVIENRGSPVPRFRVAIKTIVPGEAPTAHVVVSFGGTQVSCGPLVQEIGHNEFILPRTNRDDSRTSVFHYHERGDTLDFMRIKFRGIDAESGAAEIDVMQVSGHWLAG